MAKSSKMFHAKFRWRLVTRLMARDGENCRLCGLPLDRHIRDFLSPDYITFDHVRPISRGGVTKADNLQLAHRRCNEDRGCRWEPGENGGEA